jgi:hypothetical protein
MLTLDRFYLILIPFAYDPSILLSVCVYFGYLAAASIPCFDPLPKNEMKNEKEKGCSPARSMGSLKSERSSPTQKVMYALAENEDFDRQEIVTYEEVARLMPYPAVPRPIVLIGPPGVGRNELKRRLIALDPDKFRTTIPCENKTKTFRCRKIVASTLWLNFCLTFVT